MNAKEFMPNLPIFLGARLVYSSGRRRISHVLLLESLLLMLLLLWRRLLLLHRITISAQVEIHIVIVIVIPVGSLVITACVVIVHVALRR